LLAAAPGARRTIGLLRFLLLSGIIPGQACDLGYRLTDAAAGLWDNHSQRWEQRRTERRLESEVTTRHGTRICSATAQGCRRARQTAPPARHRTWPRGTPAPGAAGPRGRDGGEVTGFAGGGRQAWLLPLLSELCWLTVCPRRASGTGSKATREQAAAVGDRVPLSEDSTDPRYGDHVCAHARRPGRPADAASVEAAMIPPSWQRAHPIREHIDADQGWMAMPLLFTDRTERCTWAESPSKNRPARYYA
jgi:hypothetical protein